MYTKLVSENWAILIKSCVKISEIIRRYINVPYKPNAQHITVKCPFHAEKTGSFSINDSKNMFYCFGCKVGGDSIKFVQTIEKINFIEACQKIAHWYNIDEILTRNAPKVRDNTLEIILDWCISNLQKNTLALQYLQSRGLTSETIQTFQIGAFGTKEAFSNLLKERNISEEALTKSGLNSKLSYYFANRVIFPIYSQNLLAGLAARSLNNANPKYINTTETEYFKKGSISYGLNHVKSDKEYILLVEGYIDVCIAYQHRISAIASMGTAVSNQHLKAGWSKANEVIVAFDGDSAGIVAANKLAIEALSVISPGKTLSFTNMPQGEDPASFLLANQNIDLLYQNRIFLPQKLWDIQNPFKSKAPELQVSKYQQLLKDAELIESWDLRKTYINYWKNLWFQKGRASKTPDSVKTYNYEMILLSIILYYPSIIDNVYDYLYLLKPDKKFEGILDKLIERPPEVYLEFLQISNSDIDRSKEKLLESGVDLLPFNQLVKLAPFVRESNNDQAIIVGWFEILKFYLQFQTQRDPGDKCQ